MADQTATRLVTVRNEAGIHARPADLLVRLADKFESDIQILKNGETYDGKSILSIMTLAAGQNTQLVLQANGPDAENALDALAELFERGFDEMIVSQPTKDQSTEGSVDR